MQSNIATLGVIALIALLIAWIVNALVGLLIGEKPQDTGSLWTPPSTFCASARSDGLGVHGWPRKAVYIAGCVGVAIFLVRSCH